VGRAEIKGVMTNGWQEVPLKEIAKPISRSIPVEAGKEYRTIGVKWWGMGAYERETIDGSRTAAKTLSLVREGDLIINKIWVRHGSVAIANKEVDGCAGSGEFPTFELDLNSIEPRWIHWQTKMKSFWEKCDSLSRGTSGKNRIKPELFLTIKIPLPPLNEQHRILEGVEVLAARIAKAKSLREEINKETELLLAAELKKLRYELLDGKSPKNKLGSVTQVTAGGTPSRDNPSYWNGKIPWIRTGELLDGDIYSSGEHITEEGMKNSSAKLFPKETILIALYGQGQTRGRTGRLMVEATTNQACCAILPTPDLLEPRFTQYWLRSLYYEMREQNHGGAQPNWNGAMIKNIEISIPPLDEQRRIVAYLDSVQARLASLRELQSATGEELSALCCRPCWIGRSKVNYEDPKGLSR
jgi:type I restriction enzyme S subunit